ncbi:MAG TPA: CDP-alcohol phosphatidyltransferase family protein [Actinomycetes bacterium]|nr:CDP-alcohol phosphatidyltransferase family protein [Actinomycetes bacterium]
MRQPVSGDVSHQILTIPNILSMLRLLLIPLFIWLALGPEEDVWAFLILAVSSITDWLDGVIARRYNMISRFGQLLDPVADRLFVISTIVVLAIRDLMPWWLVGVLVLRDLFMGAIQLYVHRRGIEPLPVHYVGKAATLCLLYGLPLLLLTTGDGAVADVVLPISWAFIVWGTGIYWWSAILYAEQASAVIQGRRMDVTA